MRIASSVTAISWIPSDAIEGMPKLPFELGVARYDSPPPDHIEEGDLERLRAEDRFREANELAAWIEVEDGKIVGPRIRGHGARRLDDLQSRDQGHHDPRRRVRGAAVGARGRRRRRPVRADGRWSRRVPGPAQGRRQAVREDPVGDRVDDARPHDPSGRVVGARTRRGEHVSQALGVRQRGEPRREVGDDRLQGLVPGSARRAHAVGRRGVGRIRHRRRERARARDLARADGRPADPRAAQPRPGETLVEQGAPGDELYLVLDGVLAVEIDGEEVAEIGPGAVVGEKALLEGGARTATLRAQTRCRVGVIPGDLIDLQELEDLAATRRA